MTQFAIVSRGMPSGAYNTPEHYFVVLSATVVGVGSTFSAIHMDTGRRALFSRVLALYDTYDEANDVLIAVRQRWNAWEEKIANAQRLLSTYEEARELERDVLLPPLDPPFVVPQSEAS